MIQIDRLCIGRVIRHSSLPYRRGINALQVKRVSSSQKRIRIKYTGIAEAYSKRRDAVNLAIFRVRLACNPGIVPFKYRTRKNAYIRRSFFNWSEHRYETSSVVIRAQFENRIGNSLFRSSLYLDSAIFAQVKSRIIDPL